MMEPYEKKIDISSNFALGWSWSTEGKKKSHSKYYAINHAN